MVERWEIMLSTYRCGERRSWQGVESTWVVGVTGGRVEEGGWRFGLGDGDGFGGLMEGSVWADGIECCYSWEGVAWAGRAWLRGGDMGEGG